MQLFGRALLGFSIVSGNGAISLSSCLSSGLKFFLVLVLLLVEEAAARPPAVLRAAVLAVVEQVEVSEKKLLFIIRCSTSNK